MNSAKNSSPVGLISVLTVLAGLCLCIFAFLCTAGAASSAKISEASTEAFMAYYEADTRAEEILACLREGNIPQGAEPEEDGLYSYTCPISEQTELFVRVRLKGSDYEILTWRSRETGSWAADTALPVWTGD